MSSWKDLSHRDLLARGGGRLETFLDMVKDGSEFLTKKGIIKIDPGEYERLKVEMPSPRYATKIKAKDGQTYQYPKDFLKTPEFGGKGKGASTKQENAELIRLRKQIDKIKSDEGLQAITIQVDNKKYSVAGVESTPGSPKSDFHLIDEKGNEVVWISHKDGRSPKDFQQWGGISQRKEPKIHNHPEVQSFIKDLKQKEEYSNGLPPATSVYRKIKDRKLKNLSVYGNEYGGSLGRQNVSILIQGPVKLVKSAGVYKFQSNHIHYNGDDVDDQGFEPVLAAIYKGDRNDAGIKGTRIVIMPIQGRKFKGEI